MGNLSGMIRHLWQCMSLLCIVILNATRCLRLCLHSPAVIAAEYLFLRKQLALYQARDIMPQRASNTTRFTLVWLSQWFDWQPALAVVQPETFQRWRRQRCHLFWRDPVRSKNLTLLFPRKLQSCQHVVFTLNSTSLCSILLINVRACSGGEKRHGLEAVLGVYHRFGGPGAPPA
jgi:hypothetical protein